MFWFLFHDGCRTFSTLQMCETSRDDGDATNAVSSFGKFCLLFAQGALQRTPFSFPGRYQALLLVRAQCPVKNTIYAWQRSHRLRVRYNHSVSLARCSRRNLVAIINVSILVFSSVKARRGRGHVVEKV